MWNLNKANEQTKQNRIDTENKLIVTRRDGHWENKISERDYKFPVIK